MNICHLFYLTTSSQYIKEVLEKFEENVSMDISSISPLEDVYSDVYLIEVHKIDKEGSLKLIAFFKSRPNALVYLIAMPMHILQMSQLAFALKAKSVLNLSNDVKKTVIQIQRDFKAHKNDSFKRAIGNSLLEMRYFVIYRDTNIAFASKKILEEFACETKQALATMLSSNIEITNLLKNDVVRYEINISSLKENIGFRVRSECSESNDKYLFFEPYLMENKLSFIMNRISFIELLKDKLLQNVISDKNFSILTLNMENINRYKNDFTEIEIATYVKDFLLEVDELLGGKITLAQYRNDFYIALFENLSFDDLKIKAHQLHANIVGFMDKQSFSPHVSVYAFDFNGTDLNNVLSVLEGMVLETLTDAQIAKNNIKYISDIDNVMSEDEAIKILLDSVFANKSEFKLLNIYKGLCLHTNTNIIKRTKDAIYVRLDPLQTIVLKDERQTVLQSDSFPKEISATVSHISLKKHIAILENFSFLNSSANSRKYGRVSASDKSKVVISSFGATLNGEVLDMSVNAMAIKVKHAKIVDRLKDKEIKLTFTLPPKKYVEEEVRLCLQAKVLSVHCDGLECKIVCDLIHLDNSESLVMQYIYYRQKEIILELKKIAREL